MAWVIVTVSSAFPVPVTVTSCSVSQLLLLKLTAPDTVALLASSDVGVTVTVPPGLLSRRMA